MSVYIKGMNLPKCGFERLHIYPDGSIEYRESDESIIRVPNAVTEVKTPHGRLIDEDIVEEQLKDIEEITRQVNIAEEGRDSVGEISMPMFTIRNIHRQARTAIEAEVE